MNTFTISNFIKVQKIIFTLLIVIICCVSVPLQVFATNYYVSSSTGNDSNNGLTEATAWKTLAKVQSERNNFVPRDIIAFKAGDTWVERLYLDISGAAGNPITFTSYGAGNRPIFTVVKEQTLTWTHLGGNIWRNTTINIAPSRLMIDGKERLSAALDIFSELGTYVPDLVEWFYGDNGDGNNYLYIYSTDSPANHKVEFSSSPNGRALYLILANYLTFNNIEFQGGYYETITIYGCSNITFDSIKTGVMSRMGIQLYKNYEENPSVDNENIIIKNSLFDTEFTLDYSTSGKNTTTEFRGIFDGIWFQSCNRGEVSNCIFKNWGHSCVQFLSTENINDEAQNLKIFNNIITAPDLPYGGTIGSGINSSKNEIYNNLIVDAAGLTGIAGNHTHYHHNIFLRTRTSPIKTYPTGFGISFQTTSSGTGEYGAEDNIIENNLFYECESGGIQLSGNNGGGDVKNNIIQNNIIYNCGSEYNNRAIYFEGDYKVGSSDSNIFKNNLIYNSSTTYTIYYYGSIIDVVTFNSYNEDSHSHKIESNLAGNPAFVSETNYHLTANSPAIDAGILPISNEDYGGNSVPFLSTDPDIGIYEFINSGSTVPVASITLSAQGGRNEISTDKGMLQVNATVFPSDATDKTLTWSIVNGPGEAEISSYGYMQAISNGLVSVMARANNGSGIKGVLDIIISNQTAPMDNYPSEPMKVYPNPTNGVVTVETNEDSPGILILKVIQNNGQYLTSIPMENNREIIDFSSFNNGIYILQLYNDIRLLGTTILVKQ